MKVLKLPLVWLLLAGASVPLLGCDEGGVFEEAGEEVDDAVDEVEDEIDRRN
jgi:hypothetical protein